MANEDLVDGEKEVAVTKLSDRHELFCKTYVSNGFNATQAYIAVGYSPNGAQTSASQLLAQPHVTKRIQELKVPRFEQPVLTLEKTLAQVAAVGQFDRRKLYYADGTPIPVHLLDDATAAAISHENKEGLVPFNKLTAVEMAMKYFGAYEKDNAQKGENLAIQVVFEE